MKALRIKGGGDEAQPAVTRHEPWSQTPDADSLKTMPLDGLVGAALSFAREVEQMVEGWVQPATFR